MILKDLCEELELEKKKVVDLSERLIFFLSTTAVDSNFQEYNENDIWILKKAHKFKKEYEKWYDVQREITKLVNEKLKKNDQIEEEITQLENEIKELYNKIHDQEKKINSLEQKNKQLKQEKDKLSSKSLLDLLKYRYFRPDKK